MHGCVIERTNERTSDNARHAKSKKDKKRMHRAAEGIASSRRSVKKAAMAPPNAAPAARRKESLKLNDRAFDAMGL